MSFFLKIIRLTALTIGLPTAPGTVTSIPYDDGFIAVTQYRTLARFQRAYGESEWPFLWKRAQDNAIKQTPHSTKVLFAIAKTIDADWKDAKGKSHHTHTDFSIKEIEKFQEVFSHFKEMVFALTEGAVKIDSDYMLIDKPVKVMDSMGSGRYWLNVGSAIDTKAVLKNKYASVILYYQPGDIPMGLLGGTIGSDEGFQGAATSTLQIPNNQFPLPLGRFSLISVATLHEWLHQMSYCAQKLMNFSLCPDVHCGEELGYDMTDGAYDQWFAFNRDLMLYHYPQQYWRTFTMYPVHENKSQRELMPLSGYRNWEEDKFDWQHRLKPLDELLLRLRTGIPKLTLSLKQYRPNDYVQLVIGGLDSDRVKSNFVETPTEGDHELNNVLSMYRPPVNPIVTDANGGYINRSLEGMAVVRYKTVTRYRDLVFVRLDLADSVLHLLRVIGNRPAYKSIIGYVSLKDPVEGHPINFIVLDTDLGRKLPKDEVSALSR